MHCAQIFHQGSVKPTARVLGLLFAWLFEINSLVIITTEVSSNGGEYLPGKKHKNNQPLKNGLSKSLSTLRIFLKMGSLKRNEAVLPTSI